ncbi:MULTISPECIES: TetR/AcrR family transcriptional regulator [unclassified Pseudodesulfovibrio]|uniref:TetR/AcrR family transcriptional regulator n=1 Tax=unclassified Pseudodesulfovibrio TaxID=2661612 RepID=UPI000FEBBE3A|nr:MULTISPECIES: TetR/AcrR family transcriptional regulator [unclassified Pseudodesulfovibrio]MCJ2164921.1 TetR/AcrR family transcriptional regulator [Pseudodesulfovibrio sp. S3-i]RWU03716.1 TetR/AcrR family transcriptional regulator [Pseudodesulfovibrio sp. S3]
MRIKDDSKREALLRATVSVVNKTGFVAASVSKIAGAAQVSPATLYTYFENKDDLIISTYMALMSRMSDGVFRGVDTGLPVRAALYDIWRRTFEYVSRNRGDFLYTEQFAKSPYVKHLRLEDLQAFFAPLISLVRRGVDEKILKDVHFHMHILFFYYPILTLANPGSCHSVAIEEATIETAFQLAWDAIRL